MVQIATETKNRVDTSSRYSFFDIISCFGVMGGAVISLVTQQVAFTAVPFSVVISLQIWSRKSLSEALLMNADSITELRQSRHLDVEKLMRLDKRLDSFHDELTQLTQEHRKTSLGVISLQGRCQENQNATQELSEKLEEIDKLLQALKGITSTSGKIDSSMSVADAYYERGCQQEALKHFESAISDYSEAILKSPTYAEAYFKRGQVKAKLGLKQSAVADLNTSAKYFFEQGRFERYQAAKQASSDIHSAALGQTALGQTALGQTSSGQTEQDNSPSASEQSAREENLVSLNSMFN